MADFLNYNGIATRTNESDSYLANSFIYSNSEGQSEVFYNTSHNCLILKFSIKLMKSDYSNAAF